MKSLDGFTRHDRIPRRPTSGGGQIGKQPHFERPKSTTLEPGFDRSANPRLGGQPTSDSDNAIDLGTISPDLDIKEPVKSGKRRKGRRRFFLFGRRIERKPWSRRKKIIVSIVGLLLALLLLAGGFLLWSVLRNTGQVFKGNPLQAVFSNKPLKEDQYGRSNILLFGTSEDDPNHPGGELTDSIMVVSVNQKKHDAFVFSVPRDLWVKYGRACPSGYEGKINAMYLCGKDGSDDAAGRAALQKKVGDVFGMDMQYVVQVNFKVVQDSINALGGVDVTIESSDPRGILDRNFDWRCNYSCYYVKHPNGPVHLDGEHALYLSQARNESGGYGLPRGNFDREANQRKIMIAAKQKASSIGFLANPVKVTKLLDSLGDNVRTNFDAAEIKTLVDIAKKTDVANIQSISLIDQKPPLLTTGASATGASIVRPVPGIYDYSGLQSFVRAYMSGGAALIKENATVDVLNGTDTPGLAQTKADALEEEGIKISDIGNAPDGSYGGTKIYDLTNGKKPATKKKLEKILGVTTTNGPLPGGSSSNASFVVIAGGQ